MIRRLLCFLVAAITMISVFSLTAAAKSVSNSDWDVEINFPDEYIVLTTATLSKNTEFIESIGHSKESLRKAMNSGNIIFYAANEKNTKQFHVKCWTTDFSERIGNLHSLSGESREATLDSIKKILVSDGHEILFSNSFTHGESLFLKLAVSVKGDNPFCYIQYITVLAGNFYSLVYYNAHSYLTVAEQKEADSILSALKIRAKGEGSGISVQEIVYFTLVGLVLVGALFIIFVILRSFLVDYKISKTEPEIIPDRIKIKRNKFGGRKK